jgi:hypothetical protein
LSSDRLVLSILNIQSSGSLTNNGTISLDTFNNNDYQNSAIYNYSTNFINNKLIKANNTCFFYNYGTIYNNTYGNFGTNSVLTFYNGTSVNSTAKFYNYKGSLNCDRGIYNYGTIHNGYNGTDSTIGSSITANVNGLINYSGTIYNYSGNTITNNNRFDNKQYAIIQNYGTLILNNSKQTVTNSGIIYNSTIDASFNINTNSTNTGSIYNYEFGTITIASGKILTNNGNIINADGTGDCGTATINYSGIYGDISGNVISYGCPNPIP